MQIADVRFAVVRGRVPAALHWAAERHAGMLDRYPDVRTRPTTAPDGPFEQESVYLELADDAGLTARYGPIYPEQAYLIARKFRPFLLGREPEPIDRLWDQMYRLDRHGRTGLMMMAISAIDNALWDLKGRREGKPVCRLLADAPRETVPAYCSVSDYPSERPKLAAFARGIAAEGYRAQKWFFRAGPGSGAAGAEANLDMVQTVRETLGEKACLMFDCWMSWDDEFADLMAPELGKFDPFFVEECFPPHFLASFERLRREYPRLRLAAGEHLFTRWEARPYIEEGLLSVLQCDPDWCGGISELLHIRDLAAHYGVPLIPHGHSMAAAVQFVAAQPETLCPMAEYLPAHQRRHQYFHAAPVAPVRGAVNVPRTPGMGIEIDESKAESIERVTEWRR